MIGGYTDQIDPSARIASTAIIGNLFRPTLGGSPIIYGPTIIRAHASIGHFALIGQGCLIGEGSVVDDCIKLEPNVMIGKRSLIIQKAYVSIGCVVGDNCVVGGFLTDRSKIGNHCRVFGNIVHSHYKTDLGWDDDEAQEDSAVVEDGCFVGFGAQVIGRVVISQGSYIAANAVVTRDVPPYSCVMGINQIKPRER